MVPAAMEPANGRRTAKARKTKPLLEPLPEVVPSGQDQPSAFARALGSVDFLTRERGVQALTRLLQRKTDIAEGDMMKLWKGLYFCFWHSDKTPVQTELAERLAGVMGPLSQPVAWLYFKAFIHTMRREWFSIDRLRLDKFMMLVRKFIYHWLVYLKHKNWQPELVEQFTTWLRDHVLLPGPGNQHPAIGLSYHIADIFIPELLNALSSDDTTTTKHNSSAQGMAANCTLPPAAAAQLLQPFQAVLQRGGEDALVNRVREAVFELLVEQARGQSGSGDGEEREADGKVLGGAVDPAMLAAHLFELGSDSTVKARNRTALYGLSQALEKALKKRAKREGLQQRQQQQQGAGAQGNGVVVNVKGKGGKGSAAQPQVQITAQQQPSQAVEQLAAGSQGKKRKGRGQAGDTAHANGVVPAPEDSQDPAAASVAAPVSSAAPTPASQGKKRKTSGTDVSPAVQAATATTPTQPAAPVLAGTSQGKRSPANTALAAAAAAGIASQQQQPKSVLKGAAGAKAQTDQQQVLTAPQPATVGTTSTKQGAQDEAHVRFKVNNSNDKVAPEAASEAVLVTPANAAAAAACAKKSVRINLKKNLYFDFGGPVPDPLLRTPPTSRSKGSILKKISAVTAVKAANRRHRLAQGSQSAPAKVNAQKHITIKVPQLSLPKRQQGGKAVTPGSVTRVRAADLFN